MGFLSKIGPALSTSFDAGLQYIGAREARKADITSARNMMDFQERLSGSAHQRSMADLKAAGLNPVMGAVSSASTPAGSAYDAENMAPGLNASYNSALQAKATRANIDLTLANKRKVDAEREGIVASLGPKKKLEEGKGYLFDALNFIPKIWRGMSSQSARDEFMQDANKVRDWFSPRQMRKNLEKKPHYKIRFRSWD